MTNTKTTKRALLASVLSLLLCISMLVGSTFAWFTDSATTGVGNIVAGTLDIDLVDANGESLVGEGKSIGFVKEDGSEITTDILWEPGCSYLLEEVTLINKGNLWAKCKLVITAVNGATDGDVDLASVIDVYEGNATQPIGTLREILDRAGAVKDNIVLAPAGAEGNADKASFGQIKLVMQTTAGNEYQGKSLNSITVTVLATQATVESDSKDNTYDEKAEYPFVWADKADVEAVNENTNEETKTVVIEDGAQLAGLAQLVNEGTTFEGYTVTLENDIDLQNAEWTPMGSYSTGKYFKGTLDGNGHTVSNLKVGDGSTSDQGLIGATTGAVTVKNITFDGADVQATGRGAVVIGHAVNGAVTLENITITGDVKIEGKTQLGTVIGSGANASYTASNITVNVNEGSYVSSAKNTNGNSYDYAGGVFGQVWGSSFTNITSNIDVIGCWAYGVGGITGGATGTWENITCTGDVTILNKDTTLYYTNSNPDGNAYGDVYWWQCAGLISGHHDTVTFKNCNATGTLTYVTDNTTTNGMYFYNTAGVKCEDNRFGATRYKNDNTVTIID